MTALGVLCIALAALFDVQRVELPADAGPLFFGYADADGRADPFVLRDCRLSAYPSAEQGLDYSVDLSPGTTAFDLADVDGDGRDEVVAVCGDRILCQELAAAGGREAVRELFRAATPLAAPEIDPDHASAPFPYLMAVRLDKKTVLALPCANGLELRALDGAPVTRFSFGPEGPRPAAYFSKFFWFWSRDPAYLGPPGALQFLVRHVIEYEPVPVERLLSGGADSVGAPPAPDRGGDWLRAWDAADREFTDWPWFAVTKARDGGPAHGATCRARYAFEDDSTLIRIETVSWADVEKTGEALETVDVGPALRYPGLLSVLEDELPDFNGDGYTDLLLWQWTRPGRSLDSLARAAAGMNWPMRFRTHLYAPGENRYAARPSATVAFRVPIAWCLTGRPHQFVAVHDFDGDGRTDLGLALGPTRYAIWLYTDGFASEPDFTCTLAEPLTEIEFETDLEGNGRTTLGLRTAQALYLVRAAPD